MARTNWGPIILGMGLLGGGIYVFLRWEDVCPTIMGAGNCTTGNLVGDVRARIDEYNSRPSCNDPNNRTSNCRVGSYTKVPQAALNKQFATQRAAGQKAADDVHKQLAVRKTLTPAQKSANVCAAAFCKTYPTASHCLQCPCPSGQVRNRQNGKCYKPITQYTNTSYYGVDTFNSFNTFTLNRMSVR